MLIPVEDYFPGAELPPHLSPFVQEKDGDYMPPERRVMLARLEGKQGKYLVCEYIQIFYY